MAEELATHPGQLCLMSSRAVDLALELGRARLLIEQYEARIAELEEDRNKPYGDLGEIQGASPPLEVYAEPIEPGAGIPLGFVGGRRSEYLRRLHSAP